VSDHRGDDGDRATQASLDEGVPSSPAPPDTAPSSHALSRASTDFGLRGETEVEADLLLGLELGDVTLLRLIGQGGMGRVYEARQRTPARSVAVKVMRPGLGSALALQRFRREAEVLGRLRHPGIGQVYTAGVHHGAAGEMPYLVLEFVPGAEPLVRFCDRRGLDTRQRLRLLREVCDAVGHGHAQGVVHRDLKPSNILVDADGRPKVIDFGIARISDDLATGDAITETGQFVGTRQYMSPEQFRGDAVDARSDVYALGVILHELLTGRLPHDVDTSSLVEAARLVCDEPPRPLKIADAGLGRGVAAIAARCLAKRPGSRYADAAEFAADIDRLLAGEPVQARPPGLLETVRLRLRRHRVATSAAMAAIVTAVAVWLVTLGVRSAPRHTSPIDLSEPLDVTGPSASFDPVSDGRTTPLDRVTLHFDEPVRSLSTADLRLSRDGIPLPTASLAVKRVGVNFEVGNLKQSTAQEGHYVLELVGTDSSPVDAAGNRLVAPAQTAWQMPPYHEFAFNLLDDRWRSHVVSMTDIEYYTEQDTGADTFIRPTVPGKEGTIVLRFDLPFTIHAASLLASIHVWTTGDPFPYDPQSRAAVDVSPDGEAWITVAELGPGNGGEKHGPHDIGSIVSGGRTIFVRGRLTGTREWPGQGLLFSQFLRSNPQRGMNTFVLTAAGPHPPVIPNAETP
jgi:serine/threonine protein kinase